MSATATTSDNSITYQTSRLLQDYEIHLTGAVAGPSAPTRNERQLPAAENPPDWPQNFNSIPQYRPINRNLDISQRPSGENPVERVFVYVMMHGVWLESAVAQTWKRTGGRLSGNIFRYAVGGEW